MKDFHSLREATTGRDGVKCGSEKSQFGGYRAVCKRGSKNIYSGGTAYKDAATAKKEAEVYADAYYGHGDRAAQRAVQQFKQKNASKKFVKESVEVDEAKELTYQIRKDGKPLKKGSKTVEIYGVAKAKKMVDDLNKKHRGSKFTAHHVYKDGDDLDEGKLPPHLSKFFDKKGNLNKDAEERVKKGRKKRGLDPITGKKLKSVKEELDEAKESGMDIARRIVKNKQHEKGVDLTTAGFIVQIYDKVNDTNKKKMDGSSLKTLVGLAQRMMKK